MAKSCEAPESARSGSCALRPVLSPAVTGDLVADASRDAALAFCRGVAGGWSKRELAAWLRGPYQAVAGLVDSIVAPPVDSGPQSTPPPSMTSIDEESLAGLLEAALESAMECVLALARGEGHRHLEEAIAKGSLVEAITLRGEVLFVPLHRPRLRLARRVSALFVADYLRRPEDYENNVESFCTCEVCGVILLGEGAREQGLCGLHQRRSGIVPRDGLMGPGLAFTQDEPGDDSIDVDLSELLFNRVG